MSRRKPTGSPRHKAPGDASKPAAESGAAERRPDASAEPASLGNRHAERSVSAPSGAGRAAPRGPSLLVQVALLIGIFLIVTLIAELAGAANLGVAIGVGQIAFAIALVALILRAP